MKVGRKSILFGVHQFLIHPVTVFLAWVWLYRSLPNWREMVCIVMHDWGYFFMDCDNMDDEAGEKHPEWAAGVAYRWLGGRYYRLCLFHSRHYARTAGVEPSKLCWADKASVLFEKWWTYLPRALLSGELMEYRWNAHIAGLIHWNHSNREWFEWIQEKFQKLAQEQRGDAVPYMSCV